MIEKLGKAQLLQRYLAADPGNFVIYADDVGRRLRLSLDMDLDPSLMDMERLSVPWVPNMTLADWIDVAGWLEEAADDEWEKVEAFGKGECRA